MWRWLAVILVLAGLLAGCGGDDSSSGGNGGSSGGDTALAPTANSGVVFPTVVATATMRPPAPRARLLPEGDPILFEVPFSSGNYTRQILSGRPTATHAGGQRATYQAGDTTVALTVMYFADPAQAVEAVRYVLDGATITNVVGDPYFSPAVAFGVAQDRHGNQIAAWSQYNWYFLARSTGNLDSFLEVFPY